MHFIGICQVIHVSIFPNTYCQTCHVSLYIYEIYVCYIVISSELTPGEEYVKEGDYVIMLIHGV